MDQMRYTILADLVLITHTLCVIFIVGGLVLILAGKGFGWVWTRNFLFRVSHLTAIIVVTLQAWLGKLCPLTTLEIYFRQKTGLSSYKTTFIAYWLHKLLFYEAPMWVFSVCYTLFGLAVVASWIFIPPHVPWKRTSR